MSEAEYRFMKIALRVCGLTKKTREKFEKLVAQYEKEVK